MTTRYEREKKQSQNDHFKKVLAQVIAKEENKFCADCLAKGPRWVSWNLGVLLCIRCSGIHRSLGVHISKVKSVNLDTWTSDQLVSICRRGNGWARDQYEANLPRDFKRPQSDSSMEYFIRDKYEKLKYSSPTDIPLRPIDLNTPQQSVSPKAARQEEFNIFMKDVSPKLKTHEKRKEVRNGVPIIRSIKTEKKPQEVTPPTSVSTLKQTSTTVTSQKPSAVDDLLGLSSPVSTPAPSSTAPTTDKQPSNDLPSDLFGGFQSHVNDNAAGNVASTPQQAGFDATTANQTTSSNQQMSKDSILSLYSQGQARTMHHNSYIAAGSYNMPNQATMPMYQQNMGYQAGYNQQVNTSQGAVAYPPQQNIQPYPQQHQQFNWQQQQMQQQMQNMQLGGAAVNYGGMRSCNSMPQMSLQNGGVVYGGQMQAGNLLAAPGHNALTTSQPTLSGLDTFGSWNQSQVNSGQTLSNQLWK